MVVEVCGSDDDGPAMPPQDAAPDANGVPTILFINRGISLKALALIDCAS